LRITTKHNNSFNSSVSKNNQTGYIGVSYHPELSQTSPWKSNIMYNGKSMYLGSFSTIDEALKTRLLAEIKYFGKDFAPQRHLFHLFLIGEDCL
jgi:hypothetical protein